MVQNKTIVEICVDEDLKIISTPCYIMDAKVNEVYNNVKMTINKLSKMIKSYWVSYYKIYFFLKLFLNYLLS